MSDTQPVHGVLLDVDGTLIASNDAHAHAWVEALADCGFAVPFTRVRPLIGMGGDKVIPVLTGLPADDPRAQRLAKHRAEIFLSRWLPTIRPFDQARELVQRIRDEGIRIAVATSAKPEELDQLLAI